MLRFAQFDEQTVSFDVRNHGRVLGRIFSVSSRSKYSSNFVLIDSRSASTLVRSVSKDAHSWNPTCFEGTRFYRVLVGL